ncbi:MAG: PHP domain-containing protein [Zoogloeaceae bacterium]|nr:PHP domain-containing protein [Zoogloeaceae bacterium]
MNALPRNPDLHCHSTASDGWLPPAEVVRRAHANGVDLLALTDHDTLGGLDEALATAEALGMQLVAGVEISVSFANETVHIVGLGVDRFDAALNAGLATLREGRQDRARRMGEALAEIGVPGIYEGALQFAHNPEMVGRAHLARQIVASGRMPDVGTVFRHYLAKGKPGYVEHRWATLEEAVGWIRGAGGVAVIAHPARYRLDDIGMEHLFDRFLACGGEGVEVVSGSHTDDEVRRYADIARRRGMLASRASDFHGVEESRIDLGLCPPLPDGLEPVWSRF